MKTEANPKDTSRAEGNKKLLMVSYPVTSRYLYCFK